MDENQNGQGQPAAANLNPELAGYPNVESLVQGYRESGAEAKRQRERAEQLERALADRTLSEEPAANQRQPVRQRSTRPEDRLSEYGVPVDALGDYVMEKLQGVLTPLADAARARTDLMHRNPDYGKFEPDVMAFIDSDPKFSQSYYRMAATDPAAAFEYAFLKFGESRRRSATGRQDDTPQESAHAAIPGSRNGESIRQPQGNSAELQRALQEYQRTGSNVAAREYARARLHNVITDEFLNT